jgi:transcriptional regulator with XRE-family HTH domain
LSTLENSPIPRATLGFFERNNQNRFHSLILRLFKQSGLTQLALANKLGKEPAQINRLLSSASNLTISTITALLLAMGVDLDDPSGTFIKDLVAMQQVPATIEQAPASTPGNNVISIFHALTKKGSEQSPAPLAPLETRITTGATGR